MWSGNTLFQYFLVLISMFALRPWMPWLKGKVTKHIRYQIKQRAAIQNKEMVKHSISKTTQKSSVSLDEII